MAAWVQLQLRRGRSVTGHQVVSAANLAECYVPHVNVPAGLPGSVSMSYGMGWNEVKYADGTRLIAHGGAIDGFNTFMAFFPEHDLGLVVTTSLNTMVTGDLWPFYSLSLLLSQRFGINPAGPQQVLDMNATRLATLADLARQARPVDLKLTEPYLGYYEGGWSVVRQGRELQLRIGPRVFGLKVMPDGSYVVSSGSGTTIPLRLAKEADFSAYLRARLDKNDGQCRNFQSSHWLGSGSAAFCRFTKLSGFCRKLTTWPSSIATTSPAPLPAAIFWVSWVL